MKLDMEFLSFHSYNSKYALNIIYWALILTIIMPLIMMWRALHRTCTRSHTKFQQQKVVQPFFSPYQHILKI